jgi:hypothetical protein
MKKEEGRMKRRQNGSYFILHPSSCILSFSRPRLLFKRPRRFPHLNTGPGERPAALAAGSSKSYISRFARVGLSPPVWRMTTESA